MSEDSMKEPCVVTIRKMRGPWPLFSLRYVGRLTYLFREFVFSFETDGGDTAYQQVREKNLKPSPMSCPNSIIRLPAKTGPIVTALEKGKGARPSSLKRPSYKKESKPFPFDSHSHMAWRKPRLYWSMDQRFNYSSSVCGVVSVPGRFKKMSSVVFFTIRTSKQCVTLRRIFDANHKAGEKSYCKTRSCKNP